MFSIIYVVIVAPIQCFNVVEVTRDCRRQMLCRVLSRASPRRSHSQAFFQYTHRLFGKDSKALFTSNKRREHSRRYLCCLSRFDFLHHRKLYLLHNSVNFPYSDKHLKITQHGIRSSRVHRALASRLPHCQLRRLHLFRPQSPSLKRSGPASLPTTSLHINSKGWATEEAA